MSKTSEQLAVNDLFATIQGEGTNTGRPMVFLRLQGCPVGCPFCDTKETWGLDVKHHVGRLDEALGINDRWTWIDPSHLVQEISLRWPALHWVNITGGEPAEQNLLGLTGLLSLQGFSSSLETSGTALIRGTPNWITLSPKIGMPGGKIVLREAVALADEVKWPVGSPRDIENLRAFLSKYHGVLKPNVGVWLQPLSQSDKATALCVETALDTGWRVSAQVHKFLGLP